MAFDRKNGDEVSSGGMLILGGELTLWGCPGACEDTKGEVQLRLSLHRPLVIGRFEGGRIPYLDPEYAPTTIMPSTGRTILQADKCDQWVSRGHFTLGTLGWGILLINGVPGRDGNIRPPTNGTRLLSPVERSMAPGERYVIEPRERAVLRLPNGTELQIRCD